MSRRWPGWENLDGIDVAGGCRQAVKQELDYVVMRVLAGPNGVDGSLDMYPVAFHADGHVSVLGGDDVLECVVTEGMLTGIYHKEHEVTCTLVKCLFVQIPDGGALPFLHYYVAGEPVAGTFANTIDAAIDCSPEESGGVSSTLGISICQADGQLTSVSWPLTPESAYALIGLMRTEHGAPWNEMITDPDEAKRYSENLLAAPGTVSISTQDPD